MYWMTITHSFAVFGAPITLSLIVFGAPITLWECLTSFLCDPERKSQEAVAAFKWQILQGLLECKYLRKEWIVNLETLQHTVQVASLTQSLGDK